MTHVTQTQPDAALGAAMDDLTPRLRGLRAAMAAAGARAGLARAGAKALVATLVGIPEIKPNRR